MLQSADVQIAPPAPPTPPAPPATTDLAQLAAPTVLTAHDVLMAMQAQRNELREQLTTLEQKREEITSQIQEQRSQGMNISGLEARLKDIDARISAVDIQAGMADQAVAKAAAVPGAVIEEPQFVPGHDGPPDGVFVLSGLFIVAVLMPMSIAIARRLWKRSGSSVAAVPSDVGDRLRAIEQAVESVAVEVERIGEGQRFMSRVFTDRSSSADQRALGEGAASAVEVASRQKVAEPR